jgi:hypothetical protein
VFLTWNPIAKAWLDAYQPSIMDMLIKYSEKYSSTKNFDGHDVAEVIVQL